MENSIINEYEDDDNVKKRLNFKFCEILNIFTNNIEKCIKYKITNFFKRFNININFIKSPHSTCKII